MGGTPSGMPRSSAAPLMEGPASFLPQPGGERDRLRSEFQFDSTSERALIAEVADQQPDRVGGDLQLFEIGGVEGVADPAEPVDPHHRGVAVGGLLPISRTPR